jgi:hypothetical protein
MVATPESTNRNAMIVKTAEVGQLRVAEWRRKTVLKELMMRNKMEM